MRKQTYYTIEVRDKNGRLLKRERHISRSFVKAYNQIIGVQARQQAENIKLTSGSNGSTSPHALNLAMNAGAGVITFGIVVGRGSTAVAIDDYKLETICDEGTSTDELNYQGVTVSATTTSAPDCSFTVTRSAINNSGATITITEIGIYVKAIAVPYSILAIRDILPSSIDVPDGGAITVVYTIKVTV